MNEDKLKRFLSGLAALKATRDAIGVAAITTTMSAATTSGWGISFSWETTTIDNMVFAFALLTFAVSYVNQFRKHYIVPRLGK